jgi:CheY-like chemotaxis protein
MNVPVHNDTRFVLAVVNDLMFGSRIRGAADNLGVRVIFARSAAALEEQAPLARLILLDLGTRWLDPARHIVALKASAATAPVPIVAFGSHVETEILTAARAAGAERVLARSAFVKVLPQLLRDG